jgi:hypothetical protein
MISAIQIPSSVFSMVSYKTARPKQMRADHPSSIKNIGMLYTTPQNRCANDHQSIIVVLEEDRPPLLHRKSHMNSGHLCLLSHHSDSLLIYLNTGGFYTPVNIVITFYYIQLLFIHSIPSLSLVGDRSRPTEVSMG